MILTVHASSKQSRVPGFENPGPEPGPLNPQLLPATLCYVPRGGIWNAHILILSMAQPTEIAEAVLETCELIIYTDIMTSPIHIVYKVLK